MNPPRISSTGTRCRGGEPAILPLLLGLRGGLQPCGTVLLQSVVLCGRGSGCSLIGVGSHASNKGEEIPFECGGRGEVDA